MLKNFFTGLLTAAVLFAGATFTADVNAAEPQPAVSLEYQHVRNATAKINYGGKTILVDPFLAPKGAYPGFADTPNPGPRIPLIDLPQPSADVVKNIDAVILTHTHLDHWDAEAQMLLPKNIPFFVQNAGDAHIVRSQGFANVQVVGQNTPFGDITISKTGGQHGSDEMYSYPALAEPLGDAMGFVLQSPGLKTVYFAGDTVWNSKVDDALKHFNPDVIILNTGYARTNLPGTDKTMDGSIIMGTDDVLHAFNAAPQAEIIAVHMDAVNHTAISSKDMCNFVKDNKLTERVAIPREGETLKY